MNKQKRYKMYRYLSTIYEGSLGKHVRKELPRCLVSEVKDCFPNPPGEPYVGFKESEEANKDILTEYRFGWIDSWNDSLGTAFFSLLRFSVVLIT